MDKKNKRTVTRDVVKFALTTDFSDLPAEVVSVTKNIVLDSVGCALGGYAVDKGRIAVQFAKCSGFCPEASIIGDGQVSLPNAAYANGELMNALDFDAILMPGHVSPYVVPAPLAAAELAQATGKDLIVSVAIAHEIAARIGGALPPMRIVKGKPPSVTLEIRPRFGYSNSVFGATAATCKLLRLDETTTANAVGLAGYNAPMLHLAKWATTLPASMLKYTCAGWIGHVATISALLAERGYTGDTTVLDGDFGYWKFSGADSFDWEFVTSQLGERWHVLGTEFKPYPCCRVYHSPLDAFIKIIREHELRPDDIERVSAKIGQAEDPVFKNTSIVSHVDAQFSGPYIFAAAAHHWAEPGAIWQHSETLHDRRLLAFMNKVNIEPYAKYAEELYERQVLKGLPYIGTRPALVTVIAKGHTYVEEATFPRGSTRNPLTREELHQKFKNNANGIPRENVDRAIAILERLEEQKNLAELHQLLQIKS